MVFGLDLVSPTRESVLVAFPAAFQQTHFDSVEGQCVIIKIVFLIYFRTLFALGASQHRLCDTFQHGLPWHLFLHVKVSPRQIKCYSFKEKKLFRALKVSARLHDCAAVQIACTLDCIPFICVTVHNDK